MRDKVKRFISILMTALMLVNLLPVGALAEGMKLDSNSVQSKWGWPRPTPQPTPKPAANVYVYVKATGDPELIANLTINSSGWFTIGMSANVPGMGNPSEYAIRSYSFGDVGVSHQTVLSTNFTRWKYNQEINTDDITWTEFYIDNGADDYVKAGTLTWHMNGKIDIRKVPSVYTIQYVDYDTKKVIRSYDEPGYMGQKPYKNITAPASWQDDEYSYSFLPVDGHPQTQTVTFEKQTDTLTFYYKKNTAAYTVNYYLNGTTTKVADSKNDTAPLGETVTKSPITVDGYTPVSNDKKSITIGTGTNEINFYYYENVTLTANSDTKTYDGTQKSVSGFTGAPVDADFRNITVGASGTDVGTYDAIFPDGTKGTVDGTGKYIVTATTDGQLVITPKAIKVTVTGNTDTKVYTGETQSVVDFTTDAPEGVTVELKSGKEAKAEGQNVGTYYMGLTKEDFEVESQNYKVELSVKDGWLEITPAPVTLQAPIASKSYDGTPLEATQFGHSYLEGLDFADDFESIILTGSQTLVGSSASLITGVIPNEGKKLTNYNFTFVPGTLTVTDGTGDDPVKPENVVTKTHIPKDMGYNLGEPVTFTISVKNIYNTPKTITLTEKANVKFSNGENAIEFKDVPAGETVTAEATYTITSEDILEGVFRNTVTATFGDDKSWEARDEVETAELDTTLNVTKTSNVPDGQKAALGQTITYTIKVQNAGNVPYTNVKVEDPLTGLTETIETLPVGETKTFTTEYVVTEADVLEGHVLNTATATGDKIKDPKSDEPKEPNGGDEVETPTFSPITIKPKDVTATYNGAAITGKDVEITSGKLLEGHKLSAAVIGSGVNAGSYELTIDPEKIKIVDANNKDVSEMYARTILPGKLIINKRSVLITSQSATKTYDGSALTRPAVTITGDGFVPGELAKAEATGSITNVGSTPNTIRYTTTGAFNAANYSIALSVGTLTVTEKPKPEPRRTFNLTINYVYQNGKRAAASYNRGGLKNGETFDITSPVIAGYTASETVVSGTIYNRDIKVTVIYTADGVNLDDYGVPLGLGNITMNVGDCFE